MFAQHLNNVYLFTFRAIDTLLKRSLLQLFNHPANDSKENQLCQKLSRLSSNQLQNQSLVTKNQRIHDKPYRKKSYSISSENHTKFQNRSNSKPNNIQHASPRNIYRDCNKKVHVQNLSESLNNFKIKTQSSSLTLPLSLSNVLIPARYDTDCLWAKVTRTEEVQLRNAAWYQPGLSR